MTDKTRIDFLSEEEKSAIKMYGKNAALMTEYQKGRMVGYADGILDGMREMQKLQGKPGGVQDEDRNKRKGEG